MNGTDITEKALSLVDELVGCAACGMADDIGKELKQLLIKRDELLEKATQFTFWELRETLGSPLHIVSRIGDCGAKWAVKYRDDVWDSEIREFVWEPQPSSRTDEFLKNTRFTLDEALQIVEKMRQ